MTMALRPSELSGASGIVVPIGVACANEPLGAQVVDLRRGLLVTLLYCICCCCHLITSFDVSHLIATFLPL